MSAVFITGTGTGVGKTFVAAGLIGYFRRLGQPVAALKPLVSGFDPAAPSGSDPAILLDALGREVNLEELQRVSPWRFRAPLSLGPLLYAGKWDLRRGDIFRTVRMVEREAAFGSRVRHRAEAPL